jgi:hypothetical protein
MSQGAILRSSSSTAEMLSFATSQREKADGALPRVMSVQRMRQVRAFKQLRQVRLTEPVDHPLATTLSHALSSVSPHPLPHVLSQCLAQHANLPTPHPPTLSERRSRMIEAGALLSGGGQRAGSQHHATRVLTIPTHACWVMDGLPERTPDATTTQVPRETAWNTQGHRPIHPRGPLSTPRHR